MRYTQITDTQVGEMLETIGAKSIDDLFSPVNEKIRLRGDLNIPRGISEAEMLRDAESLARKNESTSDLVCFAGAGAYDHFIPTLVDSLAAQTEFLTAYTPYQAEASQGVLQLFFEFQTMLARITGMEVANASLYEGASAAAEASLMARSITRRTRIIASEGVHPDALNVLRTYTRQQDVEIETVPLSGGVTDQAKLAERIDEDTAAVLVASPNFFGCIERLDKIVPVAHERGALVVVSTDPIACGMMAPPGHFDVDIVVGEGQALGVPLQYGGPYLGLLACREKYLRKMPGRVVGQTKDKQGRRAFCLALQTREQHIKRERATSNICTNQGLLAVRASIYLASLGKQGLVQVANQCFDKAHYAAERIAALDGYELAFDQPFFKEFCVRTTRGADAAIAKCRERGIIGGVALSRFDESLTDLLLIAVTEKRSKDEIDALVSALDEA